MIRPRFSPFACLTAALFMIVGLSTVPLAPAFATISYATKVYTMHSNAMGRVGDFVVSPTVNGFSWEIPAGPVTIRYTAVVKDGTSHEVGDRIEAGKDPVRFFDMNLKRVGDTDWPAVGAISRT